jgi:hypothetical protein
MLPRPETNFRYFMARLKTFARPQFWVMGLGLVGLLAFAWHFSQNEELRQALSGTPQEEATPEKKEDQAIGADIDSLPLLSADFNPKNQSKSDFTAADQLKKMKLPTLGDNAAAPSEDSLAKLFGGATSTPSGNEATLAALRSPLNNALLGNGDTTSQNPFLPTSLAATATAAKTTPTDQLSAALNRYSPAQPNPNAPVPVRPAEPVPNPAETFQPPTLQGNAPINTPIYSNLPPLSGSINVNPRGDSGVNSFTGLTSGSVPDAVSVGDLGVASPAPLSTSPIPISPGSTALPPGTSVGTPIAPIPSTPTSAPVEELPFTTPRSIPGRSIGGGEINTFSNP